MNIMSAALISRLLIRCAHVQSNTQRRKKFGVLLAFDSTNVTHNSCAHELLHFHLKFIILLLCEFASHASVFCFHSHNNYSRLRVAHFLELIKPKTKEQTANTMRYKFLCQINVLYGNC